MPEPVLQRILLDNGLELIFIDQSNRYFGDFYRIHILAVCRCLLTPELLARSGLDPVAQQQLLTVCGGTLEQTRVLSRMGVAGPETDAVKAALVADFLTSTRSYLEADDFPIALILSKSRERKTGRTYYDPKAD